jgi:hypothetical protein
MADNVLTQRSWAEINKCNQKVYEISHCSKSVEREENLQEALLEIKWLQLINKRLCKELGLIDSKSEVMANTAIMAVKRNVDYNSGQSTKRLSESNLGNDNEQLLYVTEDVKLRKKEKCYYDVEMSQNKHIVTCCVEGRIEIPIAMQRIQLKCPKLFCRQDSMGNRNNGVIVTT